MFEYAIVRRPGPNFAEGITSASLGAPDLAKTLRQFAAYTDALRQCALAVIELPADAHHPDGVFVEDTAVVTERCAVIARPGHPARQGEELALEPILARYRPLERITAPGTLEGGDVLRLEDHFFIGLSRRTNAEGARQLARALEKYGYSASPVPVRGCLHLKSGVAYLGHHRLVIAETLEAQPEFARFNKIVISAREAYAANCLLVNKYLLVAQGFAGARAKLELAHPRLLELEMSEFAKMDGGLTCLSLRF